MRLASVSVHDFPQKKVVLADLTAFLLTFVDVLEGSFSEYVNVIDKGDHLVWEPSESGISVLRLRNDIVKKPKDLLKSLVEGTESVCSDRGSCDQHSFPLYRD